MARKSALIAGLAWILGFPGGVAGEVSVNLDSSEAPDLHPWGQEAVSLVEDWHPRICNLLSTPDFEAPRKVGLRIRRAEKGVGSTSGTRITIVSSWIERHPEDFGLVIHELVHVIQAYPKGKPWWVTEGIADYVRWAIYEGKPLDKFPRPKMAKGYTRGYQVAAGFLFWLETGAAPGIVRRLNQSMRSGTYDDALFEEQTGKSLDQLWSDYVGL